LVVQVVRRGAFTIPRPLFTRSFAAGTVPLSYKAAYVTPLLKKPDLDPADVRSYHPISNLSVVSKLQERLVAGRLTAYLTSNGLMPSLQSAFRANHSTETAVLLVLSDILRALDRGDLASLTLFDLSAAFDTVDQSEVRCEVRLEVKMIHILGQHSTELGSYSSLLVIIA
jgi:hypothetical protein